MFHVLHPEQQRQLGALLDVLEADAHAPTSVRRREQAAQVHIADSLAGLEIEELRRAERVADIGSGAGFPGLPLAVALPDSLIALVDSRRRACEHIERACRALGLANARVVCSRVEEWREGQGANDAVLARALAPQPVVLEYAAPLLRRGGVLVDWRGRRDAATESSVPAVAEELGLSRVEIRRVQPFADARDRHLHVFVKISTTPARFPRRPGLARKRPLGR